MTKHQLRTGPYRSRHDVRVHFHKMRESGVSELTLLYPVRRKRLLLEIFRQARKSEVSIVALHTRMVDLMWRSAVKWLDYLYRPNDLHFLRWLPLKQLILDGHLRSARHYQDLITSIRDQSNAIRRLHAAYCVVFKAELRFSYVDATLLEELVRHLVDHGFTEINMRFAFPRPSQMSAKILKQELAIFCHSSIARNAALRISQMPFCFVPAPSFRLLYRALYDQISHQAFFQRQRFLIDDIKHSIHRYQQPCRTCRRRAACYAMTKIADHPEYQLHLSPSTETTIVFVGASLTSEDIRNGCANDLVFATPAQQGDAFMAIVEGFHTVLLLDGYFYQRYALTTFELLVALLENVNVFGASSLGALRGLELANYGMRSQGYVYNFLRTHKIVPYHVVAQTYDERDRPTTESLISIHRFLEVARAAKLLDKRTSDRCYAMAEDLHFTQLTYQRLFEHWATSSLIPKSTVERLKAFLASSGTAAFDVKRQDALSLLQTFRKQIERDGPYYTIRTLHFARDVYVSRLRAKYRDHYDSSLPAGWKTSLRGREASSRERPLHETLALAERFFSDLGVVVSDTSLLDKTHFFMISVVFVPFFFLDYGNSAGSGYGGSIEQALVSAYCEVLERIPAGTLRTRFADYDQVEAPKCSFRELPFYQSMGKAMLRYFVGKDGQLIDRDYVECTDIVTGSKAALPKHGARLPSSSGMAAGNTMLEAVLYGLYEVVEHDIYAVWETNALFSELRNVTMDPAAIQDEALGRLISDLTARGHQVHFFNLLNQYDIPMVLSVFYEADRELLFSGIACRLDLQAAMTHSFHEALNGHFVTYFGSRDDRWGFEQEHLAAPLRFIERLIGQPRIFPMGGETPRSLTEQLNEVLTRLQQRGIKHVFAIDLSPCCEYHLSVAKVVVPGMERRRAIRRTSGFYGKCLETQRLVNRFVSGVDNVSETVWPSSRLRREFSLPVQRFFKA